MTAQEAIILLKNMAKQDRTELEREAIAMSIIALEKDLSNR